jgi:hypothetical protein
MKSILIGNGVNINFTGKTYTSRFILDRVLFNARANKYDCLFLVNKKSTLRVVALIINF